MDGSSAVVTPDQVAGTGGRAEHIAAIEQMYRGYAHRILATVYGLTGSMAEAQDAVQEAFARAVASPAKVRAASNPEAWLLTVARNIARSRYRRRRRLDVLLHRSAPPPDIPGLSPDRVALLTALQALPMRQREAIALHYLADLDIASVAEIMAAPLGTVKSWIRRGRLRLAEQLGTEDEDDA